MSVPTGTSDDSDALEAGVVVFVPVLIGGTRVELRHLSPFRFGYLSGYRANVLVLHVKTVQPVTYWRGISP